jgi:ADP-heptose:LPS heptosyltransferase
MRLHRLIDPVLKAALRLPGRRGRPQGVLLVSGGGLGDTVLFARVLPRFLELAGPGEPVHVLLRADAAAMAFLFPPGVTVIKADWKRLREVGYRRRLFAELYQANYRLAVSTDHLRHPDLDEALIFAATAAESAAMEPRPSPKHGRRLAANRKKYGRLFDSGANALDKVVRLSAFADFLTGRPAPPPRVRIPDAGLPPPAPLDKPTVVLQPFSAVSLKHSPPALWARIIKAVPAGWEVRLAGHPSDLDKNPDYRPLLDLPGVSFEPAPFKALAPILRAARLVVSVDSACMHLAAAMGAPTLCLASAAYVGEIVPYAPAVMPDNLVVLCDRRTCEGCLGECRFPPVAGMYPCVAALEPDKVIAAIRALTGG